MRFDQHVHAEVQRRRFKLGGLGIRQRRHDQQNTVGAERARFDDLIGLQHEVLAQHRQIDRRAGLLEIVVAALKVGFVGQHRETVGATLGIGAGQRCRLEVLSDQTLGGRGFLDLADQCHAALAGAAAQGRMKAARWRGFFQLGLQPGQGLGCLLGGDRLAFVGADLGEHVGHDTSAAAASRLMAIRRSSTWRAAPLSMASAAWAAPSFRSLALSAMISAAAALSTTISR